MHPPPGVPAGPQVAKVQEMLRNAALSLVAVATITTSGAALPDLVRHYFRGSPKSLPPLAYCQLPKFVQHRMVGSSREGMSVKPQSNTSYFHVSFCTRRCCGLMLAKYGRSRNNVSRTESQ